MATWKKVVVESSADNIAQKAATAGVADSITSQGALATLATVDTAQIDASAIETANINNSAVTSAKIDNNAVLNQKIADNAVSEAKLYSQNSASNGQVLSFSGSDAFTWVDQTSQVTVDASINSSSSNPVENHVVYDQLALKANVAGNTSQAFSTANLVVMGTLTVSGSTTTVNTEEINLADNVIVFNSNLAGDTAPTQDSGITVNRGNATAQSFYWDETNHAWAIGHTESGNSFTKTGYVSMANAQTYSSTQDNVNGFGEVGHFQIDGDNVYIRTA